MNRRKCDRKDDSTNYFCFLCNIKTEMKGAELTEHYNLKHPNVRIYHRKIEDFVKLSYVCDICGSVANTALEADEHVNQHEVQYTCIHCSAEFRKQLDYALHVYDHTQVAKCELCNKTLKDRKNLQNHYATHLNSMNPYLCDIANCKRRFLILQVYREHLQRHEGVKKYQCDICPKSFITETSHKAHLQIHSANVKGKVANYECNLCGVTYKHIDGLKRHNNRKHEEEQHQICDTCGIGFLSNQELKKHASSHEEEPFPCRYCDKTFTFSALRKNHERFHTEKPFICELCGKGYTTKKVRNSHKVKCKGPSIIQVSIE